MNCKRQWLTRLRLEQGYASIEDLAKRTGIAARTIRGYEDGVSSPHGPNRLVLIATLGAEVAQKLMSEELLAAGRLQAEGMGRPAVA